MFVAFSSVVNNNLDIDLSSKIVAYLINIPKQFLMYFPEISNVDLEIVRKSFAVPIE